METYIILSTMSGSAADMDFENDTDVDMAAQFNHAIGAVGGKLIGSWFTLGRFDAVMVVEVPNVMAIRALVSSFPSYMQSETLRAFPGMDVEPEFFDLIKNILKK